MAERFNVMEEDGALLQPLPSEEEEEEEEARRMHTCGRGIRQRCCPTTESENNSTALHWNDGGGGIALSCVWSSELWPRKQMRLGTVDVLLVDCTGLNVHTFLPVARTFAAAVDE